MSQKQFFKPFKRGGDHLALRNIRRLSGSGDDGDQPCSVPNAEFGISGENLSFPFGPFPPEGESFAVESLAVEGFGIGDAGPPDEFDHPASGAELSGFENDPLHSITAEHSIHPAGFSNAVEVDESETG